MKSTSNTAPPNIICTSCICKHFHPLVLFVVLIQRGSLIQVGNVDYKIDLLYRIYHLLYSVVLAFGNHKSFSSFNSLLSLLVSGNSLS